jgi:dTDP-4-dehydrorhamnose reductase
LKCESDLGTLCFMKFILLGANGMLGTDLTLELRKQGHLVSTFSSSECDITSRQSISTALLGIIENFDVLINCAAYTKVDNCEIRPKKAFDVNAQSLFDLVDFTRKFNVILVHFSTDYVFNGLSDHPYDETDVPDPISVYGESKLEGERNIVSRTDNFYIFRVQWLYGHQGQHFIDTILRLAKEKDELHIVNDQWGSPSSTADLSRCVTSFLTQKKKPDYGVYHLANQGYVTWFDFAKLLIKLNGITCNVLPTTSAQFKRPAPRPLNGRLNCDKFLSLNCAVPSKWDDAVKAYLSQYHPVEG